MGQHTGRPIMLRGGCVLSFDPAVGDFDKADVLIENERISSVAASIEVSDADIIDARNCIVMPGFVDSHRHLWEGLLRNLNADFSLAEYMGEVNATIAPVCGPEDVFAGTLVSALGALNAGVTTILDWSQVQSTPEHSEASIAALRESGLRAVFGFGASSGGVRPGDAIDFGGIRRVARDHFSSDDQLLTLAVAATGPEFLPFEMAAAEWQVAKDLNARIAVHIGCGPAGTLGKLKDFGRQVKLNDRTTYIHCNTTSAEEWKLIADTGGSVSISLPIELTMGHGMSSVQMALDHGLTPSLSVDVETSTPGDFFTQMRSVFTTQRGFAHATQMQPEAHRRRALSARDIMKMATIEGARSNGLQHKIGSLTPGKQADLIMLRTDRINVLPVNDAYSAVVAGMDTSNVDSVMVAGKFVKRDGVLLDVDLTRISRLAAEARDHLIVAAGGRVSLVRGVGCGHSPDTRH